MKCLICGWEGSDWEEHIASKHPTEHVVPFSCGGDRFSIADIDVGRVIDEIRRE